MIVGIDPGIHGGIVAVDQAGAVRSHVTMDGLLRALRGCQKNKIHVVVEKAQVMLLDGKAKPSLTSTFTYAQGFGRILGIIEAYELPHTLVSPAIWMKDMLVGVDTRLKDKDRAACASKRLWPEWTQSIIPERGRKPHDGLVDAALIAEWGRRQGIGS